MQLTLELSPQIFNYYVTEYLVIKLKQKLCQKYL